MSSRLSLVAVAALSTTVWLAGCSGVRVSAGGDVAADPGGLDGDEIENDLHKYRENAKSHPGEYAAAHEFAGFVAKAQQEHTLPDEKAIVEEAIDYLDHVDPDDHRHDALADKAVLLHAVGDDEAALEAYRTSVKLHPSMHVIPGMLALLGDNTAEVSSVCKSVRRELIADGDVVKLMASCKKHGDDWAWASDEDRALFEKHSSADAAATAAPADNP